MFASKERKLKRLTGKETVKYTGYTNTGETVKYEIKSEEMINNLFANKISIPEKFVGEEVYKFLKEYEFIYDEKREYLMLILRDCRIRVKKYFYLPPVYVAWDMKKGARLTGYEPCHVRFLQKCKPIGYLMEEKVEDAYKLADFPFQKLYHPHIDAQAQACWGYWAGNLEDSQRQTAYHQVETLRGFLCDYNYRSTFFNVNVYDHDRIPTDRAHHRQPFPWCTGGNLNLGRPDLARTYNNVLVSVLGEDWLIDFCAEENENWNIWSKLINFFLYEDNEEMNNRQYSYYIKKIHDIVGVESPRVCLNYPDRDEYEDDYEEMMKEYTDWHNFNAKWSDCELSLRITQWINKRSGYTWSYGDLKALFFAGLDTWAHVNYHNIEDKASQLEMVRTVNSGSDYRFGSLMQLFGQADSEGNSPRTDGCSNLLLLLGKNNNINEIMDKLISWEQAVRNSEPAAVFEESYQEARVLRNHDYAMLTEEGYLSENDSDSRFDGNLFVYKEQSYSIKENLPEYNFMFILFDKIASTFRSMRKGSQNVKMEHQRDIINLLLTGNSSKIAKVDFSKTYKGVSLSINDAWTEMMSRFFQQWVIGEFGNMGNWLSETISVRCNIEDQDAMSKYMNGYLYDIRDLDKDERAGQLKNCHRLWDVLFPEFPKSLVEAKELRDTMDKIVITTAYREFISGYATKSKELKNVLKNTLPNMEQSELLFKEVPVN